MRNSVSIPTPFYLNPLGYARRNIGSRRIVSVIRFCWMGVIEMIRNFPRDPVQALNSVFHSIRLLTIYQGIRTCSGCLEYRKKKVVCQEKSNAFLYIEISL